MAFDCSCSESFASSMDLEVYRWLRGRFASHICSSFRTQMSMETQTKDKQYSCPSCPKKFRTKHARSDHQKSLNHSFCTNCDKAHGSVKELKKHSDITNHASGFKCCDCHRSFANATALDSHLKGKIQGILRHVSKSDLNHKASTSKASSSERSCKECKDTFQSSNALQQHLESLRHKPLSRLQCPMSKSCRRNFPSPSALVSHLENRACKSGTNKWKVDQLIRCHDKDQKLSSLDLSKTKALRNSSKTTMKGNETKSDRKTEEEDEWIMLDSAALTPATSESGFSVVEGQPPSAKTTPEEPISTTLNSKSKASPARLKCALCPSARKTFIDVSALRQHVSSPVHDLPLFRCPASLLPNTKSNKEARRFKTISGMMQHLEAGACQRGQKTFSTVITYLEAYILKASKLEMTLSFCDINP